MMKAIRMSKKYSKHKPMPLQKYLKRKDVRNDATSNKVLRDKGLDLIIVPSAELSRGRGGPRCMSMPIERED